MGSTKLNLTRFHAVVDQSMADDIVSEPTNVNLQDNVGYQLSWSGAVPPQGFINAEISIDYDQTLGGDATEVGVWTKLLPVNDIDISIVDDPNYYLDINQISAPWIRFIYTNDYSMPTDITAVADSSGSLNDTYFTIVGADGDNWVLQMDINSAATPVSLPGYTTVLVPAATNASANTVAAALKVSLASVTSVITIGGAGAHATFVQSAPGSATVANGTPTTGFTITNTPMDSVLNVYVVAKSV